MKLTQIYKILDEVAPKRLSDEYCQKYNAYDNSGILIDTGDEIKGLLFSLDLTFESIEKAIKLGANLIVTHHPVIYGKIDNICHNSTSPLGEKLIKCIKNGISVISMHLNLDVVTGGIDDSLMEGVLLSTGTGMRSNSQTVVMQPVDGGGYGKVYFVNPTCISVFTENLKRTFSTDKILCYPAKEQICKVASFCGAGIDDGTISFAVEHQVDVIISADFKHHFIQNALEKNISVMILTHYACEQYGFKKYYEKIRQNTVLPCVYHTDAKLF